MTAAAGDVLLRVRHDRARGHAFDAGAARPFKGLLAPTVPRHVPRRQLERHSGGAHQVRAGPAGEPGDLWHNCGTKDQEAIESEGHGVFTKLWSALRGNVDTRERNYLTGTELFSYVQRGVLEEADRRGASRAATTSRGNGKKKNCDGQVIFAANVHAGGVPAVVAVRLPWGLR